MAGVGPFLVEGLHDVLVFLAQTVLARLVPAAKTLVDLLGREAATRDPRLLLGSSSSVNVLP